MGEVNPFFGLAAPRVLPPGQVAYRVQEVFRNRITSRLVTPYLPEALADLLLKARRPLNRPLHHGGADDQVVTRVIPRPGPVMPQLRLEVLDSQFFDVHSIAVLDAFTADGSQSTGLLRAIAPYRDPHYATARERLAERLMEESAYHPDVAIGMACCAAGQPTHPLWRAWEVVA